MNIGCTACPARYSVPDEKIVGRKVRVTCKRCGAKLVVDGTKTPPSVVSESLPPASGSGEEYLVAFDDQHKKSLTVRALVTLYGQRVIDAATLIWREGMSEWKPLFEVEPVRLALERAGYRPSQRPPSDSEQRTSSTGEDDGDVTRIYRPNEELAARDDEATKIFESPRSSRPRPPAWNEPAKWRRDGARDPLGKGEWRERGAPAQSVPRVPKLPGGWSERGVEEDEVTRMMAPLDEAAPKSESEPPATGERSEASVLFSTRSIEQAHALSSDPLGRPLLVARPAAPLLGSEPPPPPPAPVSSAPPPAQRFSAPIEVPAPTTTSTVPPMRSSRSLRKPLFALLGVLLVAVVVLVATGRWPLVLRAVEELLQRLGAR